MSSSGSRAAILAAQDRINKHLQHCNEEDAKEPGTRSTLPIWTHEVSNGNMNFLIQFHDPSDLRGALNAMMRLIEVHGLPELQRVGILSQGSSSYTQEVAIAAKVYRIPVYSRPSERNESNSNSSRSEAFPLDIGRLEIDSEVGIIPSVTEDSEAIPFPLYDDEDVVHGQGTLALELERGISTRDSSAAARRIGYERRPDIVISDIDSGISLSGICMAFAGTSVRVFGAAPMTGFWENAWKNHPLGAAAAVREAHGSRYWVDTTHPMSAIPWRTFTAPGQLAGVFEVNQEQVYAASILARDHYRLQLEPDEAVPLAVALYNADFSKLVAKDAKKGNKQVVGIILRSRKIRH